MTLDPRGKQLPRFLATLSRHITVEQAAISEEAESLMQNIEHIKNIVAMQQNYAQVTGVIEVVNLADLVEDALRLDSGSLQRQNVQLVRNFEPDLPEIAVDKHKVLQILVNLIRNAKRACGESDKVEKILTVGLGNGGDSLKISIADNGIGIPAENLTRIFNHGFTTMRGGHGFGLHSGALAAQEMNGSLTVASEGSGKGAIFTLELPSNRGNNSQKA